MRTLSTANTTTSNLTDTLFCTIDTTRTYVQMRLQDTDAGTPPTLERQKFPSTPQKRNFTPLLGQSLDTDFLYTSRHGSTPAQDVRTLASEYDDLRVLDYSGEAEDSMPTEDKSIEQISPREKCSKWDKTLSPAKFCRPQPESPIAGSLLAGLKVAM
ncbi:hypothetical protein TruAng_003325 [Truncatella angustata]|nr:hypothetical protein TruAng_003325 [Truncatella angustata]